MIALIPAVENLINEAIRMAREAIKAMKTAYEEARHEDQRDSVAVYEELYADSDDMEDTRNIARNWQDAQSRARQAQQQLEDVEKAARYNTDDLMAALIELEDATKNTDPELHKDLRWAHSRCFQPNMDEEGYFWDFERRLEQLIEFLTDLTKPEERESRAQLITWAQEYGMTPWGKTNKALRAGIDHAAHFRS